MCGPARSLRCTGTGIVGVYSSFYGVLGTRTLVSAVAAAVAVVAVALIARCGWQSVGRKRQPVLAPTSPVDRPGQEPLAWLANTFVATTMITVAVLDVL